MSSPLVALALAVMCAMFSAAVADTAQAIAFRNLAADEARRVATLTPDACAFDNAASSGCKAPAGCSAPECSVCWRSGAVRADVLVSWSPLLMRGLAPASGRHALSPATLDVAGLVDSTLPICA